MSVDWKEAAKMPTTWLATLFLILITAAACAYVAKTRPQSRKDDEVLAVLTKRSESDCAEKLKGVVRYIADAGPESAYPILVELLANCNKDVADSAAEALANLGQPAVRLILGAISEENNDTWVRAKHAIIKVGKPAVPELVKALATDDEIVLARVEECLIQIGDDKAKTLEQAFHSGTAVSVAAEETLNAIKRAKKAKEPCPPTMAEK